MYLCLRVIHILCSFYFAFCKLYRAYDTRLRSTERRSDLYLQRNVFSNACEPIAKSVIKIDDHTCIKVQRDQIGSDIDWLWDYKGELQVISTTYHDGVYYATHPLHILPIIKLLESLHSQGFVHGDICMVVGATRFGVSG